MTSLPVVVEPRRIAGNNDVVGLLRDVIFARIDWPALIAFVRIFIFLYHGGNKTINRWQETHPTTPDKHKGAWKQAPANLGRIKFSWRNF